MKFGFEAPIGGPDATPEALARLVQYGEELGFDVVGAGDHIVIPHRVDSRYPYTPDGKYGNDGPGDCLEQLTVLSFIAGHTSTIRLLTSVMVLPYRSPVQTAKVLTTIDVLSRGRLILGCGVGWMREEFEVLGAPAYERRGAVGDEYIRAFKELWTNDAPEFNGEFVSFSDVSFQPKPVQKPHPPIWIGGESGAALRRAARLGDGWYPIGSNPTRPLGTQNQLSDRLSRLRRYAEEAGRDPSGLAVAYSVGWYDDRNASFLRDGDRRILTGEPAQVADDILGLEELGVGFLMLGFGGPDFDGTLERMERFATRVKPLTD